jgi:hypothetical protein
MEFDGFWESGWWIKEERCFLCGLPQNEIIRLGKYDLARCQIERLFGAWFIRRVEKSGCKRELFANYFYALDGVCIYISLVH